MAKTVQCNGHWDAQWLSPPLSPLGLSIPQYVSILISKGILSLRGQHSQSVIRNVSLKVFSFLFGDDQAIWWSTLICQLCHLVDYNKKQQNKTFTFGRFLNFMYFFPVLFLHILLLLLYLLSCHFWMCSWSVVTPFTGSCQVCAQVEPLEVLMALTSLGTQDSLTTSFSSSVPRMWIFRHVWQDPALPPRPELGQHPAAPDLGGRDPRGWPGWGGALR